MMAKTTILYYEHAKRKKESKISGIDRASWAAKKDMAYGVWGFSSSKPSFACALPS